MVFSFFKNVSFHLDYKAVEVLADAGEREYKEALIGILTTKINLYYDYSEKNMIRVAKWKREIAGLTEELENSKSISR